MKKFTKKMLPILLMAVSAFYLSQAQDYSWQKPHAEVIGTGDLKWKPESFKYPVKRGEEVRYIDYENGDDNNDGRSKNSAWKHHPWDTRATGNAANESGVKSYVFKRGVTYRIYSEGGEALLNAGDSGEKDTPIRLTSDPNWGEGEAVIAGSRLIDAQWKKATQSEVPERMNPENIWYIDIEKPLSPQKEAPPSVRENFGMFSPGRRMAEIILYEVSPEGEMTDLHIASDVGWHMTNPHFALHHWNRWDGEKDMNGDSGKEDIQGYDEDLKGLDKDYFDGGTLWSQYGWIIGTPAPYIIQPGDYDPEEGILAHRRQAHPTHKNVRYLVENLPQFLDKPGEYYYDEDYSNGSGRLFLRLPADRNPNNSNIELATAWNSIRIAGQNNIEISGLSFRFNGRKGAVIDLSENASDITIKNCMFEHLGSNAIYGRVERGEVMDNISVTDCDFYRVNGGSCIILQGNSGRIEPGQKLGVLDHIEVLRNRTRETGMYRHNQSRWSNVASIVVNYCRNAHIAGNIVDTAFGSGIVAQGGKSGKDGQGYDIPLIRLLVHHNKIEYTALGVNDYGGLSLWQHGPTFSYNNIVGNAVGHWPSGFFGNGDVNLSYPIYLDGGFKIYNFNSISWARPREEGKPYTSTSSAYFNVFGYLNPFVNNTVYGSGAAFGGTSGNRNDYLGNILTGITKDFISVNHGGNPSLIGGDDPGTSGIDGATTLAYGSNVFYGDARAGTVATVKQGAKKDLNADDMEVLKKQMQDYPLRFAEVGEEVSEQPVEKTIPEKEKPGASDADWRPVKGSKAIDGGINYFVPWALYATIAEWHFNENHADPTMVLDYHHYPTPVYFDRSIYYKIPVFELNVNEAEISDYTESPSESWAKGALVFDGKRYAKLSNKRMTDDILININEWKENPNSLPSEPWIAPKPLSSDNQGKMQFADDQYLTYPGEYRKTPDMSTNNFLVEVILKTDKKHENGTVLSKHDGENGYKLVVNEKGRPEFVVSANGKNAVLAAKKKINNGDWHHVLAEIDRQTGNMTIYVNGKKSGEEKAGFASSASVSNNADYLVGRSNDGDNYFKGAIDFMRISRGTLADAETDIDELYEWEFNGPVKYDFAGNKPKNQRDAGAIERVD
ncbi:MAG: LamG-like jellyroll fold domain-containing protein [Prolixibacteraceae bacterium]